MYELKDDRKNERRMLRMLCEAWGLSRFSQTPAKCAWDANLFRGSEWVGIVECRRRFVRHDGYGGLAYINKAKLEALEEAQGELGIPAIFLLHYDDGLYWMRPEDVPREDLQESGFRNHGTVPIPRWAYRFSSSLLRRVESRA